MDRSIRIRVLLVGTLGCLVALPSAAAARKEATESGTVIGIDLDTAESCVGVCTNGRVEIIENNLGRHITPSWVAFNGVGILVGEDARNQAPFNPKGTVFGIERILARRFNDVEVQREIQRVPYNIINKDGKPYIEVETNYEKNKVFSPEEISSMILVKLKAIAETFLVEKISNAVIAVPAHFDDLQRQATVRAGKLAGLNLVTLINEPSAVAIAYGLHEASGNKNVLVFDLGGGTFDVSILAIDNGQIQVLYATGDAHLGGENFDERIAEHWVKLFKEKHGEDVSKDIIALSRLRREAELVRLRLNHESSVEVYIPFLYEVLDFSTTLTRDRFEELNDDLFERTMERVAWAMSSTRLHKSQIDKILLSGGSSKIPKVQQLLEDYFDGKKPSMDVDPDVVVAYGASVKGASLSGVGCGKDEDELVKLRII